MGDEVTAYEPHQAQPYRRPGPLSAASRHDRQLYFHFNPRPS